MSLAHLFGDANFIKAVSILFFMEWVAKYIRFCNYLANDQEAGGLNRIYLATAKVGSFFSLYLFMALLTFYGTGLFFSFF